MNVTEKAVNLQNNCKIKDGKVYCSVPLIAEFSAVGIHVVLVANGNLASEVLLHWCGVDELKA